LCGATVFAGAGKSKQSETKTLNSNPMKKFYSRIIAAIILSSSPVGNVLAQEKTKPEFEVEADMVASPARHNAYPVVGVSF
jgi:hypothetical protein